MARRKGKLKFIILGAAAAVAIIVVSVLSMGDNLVYFYRPDEAIAKAAEIGNKRIRVGGMVKVGSKKWVPEELALEFVITDLKGAEITVRHHGTPPDMFKEGAGVVAEGAISRDGREISAQQLLVKHSEEYRQPADHASMDKALIEKSMLK